MKTLLYKEWLEVVRERRLLVLSFLGGPIILPLVILLIMLFVAYSQQQIKSNGSNYSNQGQITYTITGDTSHAIHSDLRALLGEFKYIQINSDPLVLIKNKTLTFVIALDTSTTPVRLDFMYDQSRNYIDDSFIRKTRDAVNELELRYTSEELARHITDKRTQELITNPLNFSIQPIAQHRSSIAKILALVLWNVIFVAPLLVLFKVGSNSVSREQEGGMLPIMFLSPTPFYVTLFAKSAVLFVVGFIAQLVMLIAFFGWSSIIGILINRVDVSSISDQASSKLQSVIDYYQLLSSLSYGQWTEILLSTSAVMILAVAFVIFLSSLARSSKESNLFETVPFLIFTYLPLIYQPIEYSSHYQPEGFKFVVSSVHHITSVIRGDSNLLALLTIFSSNLIVLSIFIFFSSHQLKKTAMAQ